MAAAAIRAAAPALCPLQRRLLLLLLWLLLLPLLLLALPLRPPHLHLRVAIRRCRCTAGLILRLQWQTPLEAADLYCSRS